MTDRQSPRVELKRLRGWTGLRDRVHSVSLSFPLELTKKKKKTSCRLSPEHSYLTPQSVCLSTYLSGPKTRTETGDK